MSSLGHRVLLVGRWKNEERLKELLKGKAELLPEEEFTLEWFTAMQLAK